MPPPPGRPYNYSPTTVRARVPQEAGVYWLRSNQGVSYIGESKNLRRRISEHTVKDPVRFQFETVESYCSRYGVMNHFWKSPKQMAHKIENTELTLYEKRFGRLPPPNVTEYGFGRYL